jgi:hypothetical protein
MIGSIERIWRHITRRPFAPVMLLVVSVAGPTDPNRRTTGYGGVLPVPGPAISTTASTARSDAPADQPRRDQRAARGRVLYADGRAPQQQVPAPTEHKAPCAERRVVQGRTPAPAPNS